MKVIFKIAILSISIFVLSLFIAKIAIDYTFNKTQCNQIEIATTTNILYKNTPG